MVSGIIIEAKGMGLVSDERILGSSDFVSRLMSEAEQKEKDILRLSKKMSDFSSLVKKVTKGEGIQEKELRSGSRMNQVVEARKLFCQLAVKKMGYPGAEVARFLGVTTSAVNKAANSEEVSSLKRYL